MHIPSPKEKKKYDQILKNKLRNVMEYYTEIFKMYQNNFKHLQMNYANGNFLKITKKLINVDNEMTHFYMKSLCHHKPFKI